MRVLRSIRRWITLPFAAILLPAAAPSAAQNQQLLTWTGNVDREIHITMRGRDVWTTGSGFEERGRTQILGAVPRAEGRVEVVIEDGRGDIAVVQHPSVRNDYTAIIRVVDRSGGADRYRLRALWRPMGRLGDLAGIFDSRFDPWSNRPGRGRVDNRTALLWSGYVDDVLEIRMRGDRIEYRTLSGRSVRDVRTETPRGPRARVVGPVQVGWNEGRGTVRVVQQASPRNGYTTIIQIRDPQSGYGRYAFELIRR